MLIWSAVDTSGLHVGWQIRGVRLPLANTRPGVDHDMLVADLEHDHRQRDRHEVRSQAGVGERLLGLLDRGILDESGIVRFAPDAVVYGRDLDRPDLVLVESSRWFKRRLSVRRTDESQLFVQPEGSGRGCGCQQTPARNV